jgi:hypothetical protein
MTTHYTVIDVVNRFEEAVYTLKRMPPVIRVGYRSAWPAVVHSTEELLCAEKLPMRPPLPSAAAISRMEETIQWIFFLDNESDRRMIWLRAARVPWKPIYRRLGISRTTAHYRYRIAMMKIVMRLNSRQGARYDV